VLGLRRKSNSGYAILGANGLARALAGILREADQDIVLIDANPQECAEAEAEGFRVLFGSGLSESVLHRAMPDTRTGCIALTANDEVNLLFARKCRKEFRSPKAWVTLRRGQVSVTSRMVSDAGAKLLFGVPRSVDFWTLALERGEAKKETWVREVGDPLAVVDLGPDRSESASLFLPVAVSRGSAVSVIDEDTIFQKGDVLHALVLEDRRSGAAGHLRDAGWRQAEPPDERPSEICTDGAAAPSDR
jgi:hypothetical protein